MFESSHGGSHQALGAKSGRKRVSGGCRTFLRNWGSATSHDKRRKKVASKKGSQIQVNQQRLILPREGPNTSKGTFPGGHPPHPPLLSRRNLWWALCPGSYMSKGPASGFCLAISSEGCTFLVQNMRCLPAYRALTSHSRASATNHFLRAI